MIERELAALLVDLVEKVGLLRRDLQQRQDLEKYEGRVARIEQKVSALSERLSADDPELSKALRTAWELPARSLAFRNAAHKKNSESSS
jgi:predicted  nucleic acid-binding Zn-ribbon protein